MIKICSLSEVKKYYHEYEYIVSIGTLDYGGAYNCSRERIPRNFYSFDSNKRIRLEFDDTNDINNEIAPTLQDIQRLIKFYETIPINANILFHCYAGISRSGAAALIYLVAQSNFNDEAIKHQLIVTRPQIYPNLLMCEFANIILNHARCTKIAKTIHDL